MQLNVDNKTHLAGLSISSNLYDAQIQKSMGGLGGCKHFDINNFPQEEQPYILMYIKGDIDSVTAIYLYMKDVENKGGMIC
jgi:hypothetical protein